METPEEIEGLRKYLFAVAYNILGAVADAEDIVQDAFADFFSTNRDGVRNTKWYLARITANKAIDRLNELKKQRAIYPGTWLPEPYHQSGENDSDKDIMNLQVLKALEELNPIERAVFVLREAFHFPFSELAAMCNTNEANCRKLLSRAKQKMSAAKTPAAAPGAQVKSLIEVFLQAVVQEDTEALTAILKKDIVMYSDAGGKAAAALKPLFGFDKVAKFMIGISKVGKDTFTGLDMIQVNGQLAALISTDKGPDTLMAFSINEGQIEELYIIRNPDKIISLGVVTK